MPRSIEHHEQAMLVQWLSVHPDWRDVPWFAVPNGLRSSSRVAAARAKAEGMRAGVPDLVVPLVAHGMPGLYVELKAPYPEEWKISPAQRAMQQALAAQGYVVAVARGFVDAKLALEQYRDGVLPPGVVWLFDRGTRTPLRGAGGNDEAVGDPAPGDGAPVRQRRQRRVRLGDAARSHRGSRGKGRPVVE